MLFADGVRTRFGILSAPGEKMPSEQPQYRLGLSRWR